MSRGGRQTDRRELPESRLNSRWCTSSEVQPLPAGASLLAGLGTGSTPFCLSVKRMGFLLTPGYCERAGRGQASSSLSFLANPFIYFVHVYLGSGGVSSLCCWRAALAAGNPSPRRRGRPGARPIPGWTFAGRGRGQDGKQAARASRGAAGRLCVPRRRGARPGPRPSSARAAGGTLLPRQERWRGAPAARSSPAIAGLRGGASPMAEGRRREDEEEELRERRELGGPRRARGRALPGHSAAGETRGARGPRPHEGGERLGPGFPWPLTHALPRAAAVLAAAWRD